MSVPGPFDREGVVKGGDFHHFYVLGQLAREGRGEALYEPAVQSSTVASAVSPRLKSWFPRPTYGPQVALAFAPFAMLPFVPAVTLFLVLSLAAYIGCVAALGRYFPVARADPRLLWLVALANPALWFLLRFGQNAAIALVCLTAGFVALQRGRPWLAGFAIGGLFYKPQMGVVFGIVWLLAREWRLVGGALISILLQLAIGWAYFGTATMLRYGDAAVQLLVDRTGAEPIPQHLHSVRGFLALLLPHARLETALFLATCGVLVWAAYRAWTATAPLPMRFAQLVLVSVLASLHLTVYDLVILLPVYFALGSMLLSGAWPWGSRELGFLLGMLFVAPILGSSVTYFTRIQLSVPVMLWLAYRLDLLTRARAA
jgi:hypothetical protein